MNAPMPSAAGLAVEQAIAAPLTETKATCCYCGVGCGVLIQSDGEKVVAVRGDPDHPANYGRLCTKGSTLHLTARPALQQQARALYPELRLARTDQRERASWATTLDFLANKFAATIRDHGPDSVGFYLSGQLLTRITTSSTSWRKA